MPMTGAPHDCLYFSSLLGIHFLASEAVDMDEKDTPG
jgi:hypothetical protein